MASNKNLFSLIIIAILLFLSKWIISFYFFPESLDVKTIFESVKDEKEAATKESEMFEESNVEENFEIPAFLRRQKS